MDKDTVIKGLFLGPDRFKKRIYLNIPDGEEILRAAYKSILGSKFSWLPEYSAIARWMAGNEGKGLFLYGDFGRGKTLFLKEIFPALMESCWKVATYYTMTGINLDEALRKKIICLDDVGTESRIMYYGNERFAFQELMDNAEQNGNLVIASSNMDHTALLEKYGQRTIERIVACCTRIRFEGKSLRYE